MLLGEVVSFGRCTGSKFRGSLWQAVARSYARTEAERQRRFWSCAESIICSHCTSLAAITMGPWEVQPAGDESTRRSCGLCEGAKMRRVVPGHGAEQNDDLTVGHMTHDRRESGSLLGFLVRGPFMPPGVRDRKSMDRVGFDADRLSLPSHLPISFSSSGRNETKQLGRSHAPHTLPAPLKSAARPPRRAPYRRYHRSSRIQLTPHPFPRLARQ
jgi:hypothetical protein